MAEVTTKLTPDGTQILVGKDVVHVIYAKDPAVHAKYVADAVEARTACEQSRDNGMSDEELHKTAAIIEEPQVDLGLEAKIPERSSGGI